MDIVYAQRQPSAHAGVLGPIQEVDNVFQLTRGIPRLDDWPSDAYFEMDGDFGVRLDDVIQCLHSIVIVSDRLRHFLEGEALPNTEMLPVTLMDLKGRPIETPYFVFHQTELQDALDAEASGAQLNAINPRIIRSIDQLVIHDDVLDPDMRVFRLSGYVKPVFFEKGLADLILREGFTGIGFGEISTYDAFSIL